MQKEKNRSLDTLYQNCGSYLVEMGGVEPPSEKRLPRLSTSVVDVLNLPHCIALTTGYAAWQLLMCDKARSTSLFTFTTIRRPLCCRGTQHRNEQLRLLMQLYCCQLFLSYGFYGGSAPPPAYQGLPSPSKPLHPHILK